MRTAWVIPRASAAMACWPPSAAKVKSTARGPDKISPVSACTTVKTNSISCSPPIV